MIIRETKTETVDQGFQGPKVVTMARVRKLAAGEDVPEGAEVMPEKTPVQDWTRVEEK